jgi:hypothetical protein
MRRFGRIMMRGLFILITLILAVWHGLIRRLWIVNSLLNPVSKSLIFRPGLINKICKFQTSGSLLPKELPGRAKRA